MLIKIKYSLFTMILENF